VTVAEKLQRGQLPNADILRLFREAQTELISIIERIEKGSRFSRFRRTQLRAIERVIVKLEANALNWADDALPEVMEIGAKETYEELKSFGETGFQVKFSGVPEEAIKQFVEEAWLDFGTTMQGLQKNAKRAALERRRVQERVFKGLVQGASVGRTQREIVSDLKKQGFTVLKAKNGFGRRFSLEAYSNMLVRTQNITAYNLGVKSQLLGTGRRYALFPTIRPDIDGPDICNDWEKKKFVDLLRDPLPPASTHPNCRHTVSAVSFDQLQRERPDLYEKARRFYRETIDAD